MIIGRERELATLEKIWKSREAEFVAIYGRRRIGKTYLINQYFSKKGIYFELIGTKDAPVTEQLENFVEAFGALFFPGAKLSPPTSWREAFKMLTERLPAEKPVTLFFDELPWIASRRSRFMQALDYFWNAHWSRMPNVKVIVCGSAASWMLEKLINAKGGLHNRLTRTIHLQPFNLKETAAFLKANGLNYNNKQVLDLYMVMGGVPHYLKQVERGKSAVQNINAICFHKDGLLRSEFPRLFYSLFSQAETNLKIIREIATKRCGVSREELIRKLGIESGGTLSQRLKELEATGFIRCLTPYGYHRKMRFYKVVDEYTMFYLTWIDPLGDRQPNENYWENKVSSSGSWQGYAFESVCDKHRQQIIRALGLEHLASEASGWRNPEAQIDLLLDRSDDAITICEIKYSRHPFALDKSEAKKIARRLQLFGERTKKQLFCALITTHGLKEGIWAEELVDQVVTLDDLIH